MLKARKLYVGLILILSAVIIYLGTLVVQDRGITPGNIPVDSIVQPEEWNYIITTDIKNSVPSLEVNGKKVKLESEYAVFTGTYDNKHKRFSVGGTDNQGVECIIEFEKDSDQ